MVHRSRLPLVASLTLAVLLVPFAAAQEDSPETVAEQQRARAAETAPAAAPTLPWLGPGAQLLGPGPLFIGVDDVTVPAYRLEVPSGNPTQAFVGFQVWGSAYDADNDQVYFNSGSELLVWPVGGAPSSLGTIVDGGGAAQAMVSLAWHDGVLYGTKNIANEAIWIIDPTTLVATVLVDYVDADLDCGGLAIDPTDGTFYCTNDDATPFGAGLFSIDLAGTPTLIAPYPAGQTDIDGLAVGGGNAYLVTDEPGDIFVWNFAGGAYATPIPNPWTSAEIFSGAAWIEVVDTMPFLDGFETGDTSRWTTTVP